MDDDHVRPEQLLAPGDLLLDRDAVVDDELEVEVGDPDARVALARRRLADVAATPAEAEVAALDRVEQHRPVDRLGGHVRERGVALELGQPEVGPERGDDRADQVGQDVLRVVELDVGEVARCSRRCRRSGSRWVARSRACFLTGVGPGGGRHYTSGGRRLPRRPTDWRTIARHGPRRQRMPPSVIATRPSSMGSSPASSTTQAADRIELVHTEVDPGYEGRGIGAGLARFALDEARRRGFWSSPAARTSGATWRSTRRTTTSSIGMTAG